LEPCSGRLGYQCAIVLSPGFLHDPHQQNS
jgi:hypothetical protein